MIITCMRSPLESKQLVWRGRPIPDYQIRNDGILFHDGKECARWQINNRNYSTVYIDRHRYTYRLDYMVAYTFKGMYEDAIRLIHIDGDNNNDCVDNLMWFCKRDVMKNYRDMAIIESDGSIAEVWRPCITEHNPDLGYQVSNFGMIQDKDGNMIPIYESHGYRVFYYIDSKFAKQTRVKAVHRAVAEAFIPNPNNYELVNHLDGNKFNDIVFNLEWASSSMNMEHAYLQGLNNKSGYTSQQIHTVCKLLGETDTPQVQIAYMTGVDRKTVSDISRGRRWSEIASLYNPREKKWTPDVKDQVCTMIISGKRGKEIFSNLGITYDQSAISFYERMRRELKASGKLS